MRATHRAVRADRQPAGYRGFFDEQGFGAGLCSIQRSDAAAEAEADDHDIHGFCKFHEVFDKNKR